MGYGDGPGNEDQGEDTTWRENQQTQTVAPSIIWSPLNQWRTYRGIARAIQDHSSSSSLERPGDDSDEISDEVQ